MRKQIYAISENKRRILIGSHKSRSSNNIIADYLDGTHRSFSSKSEFDTHKASMVNRSCKREDDDKKRLKSLGINLDSGMLSTSKGTCTRLDDLENKDVEMLVKDLADKDRDAAREVLHSLKVKHLK